MCNPLSLFQRPYHNWAQTFKASDLFNQQLNNLGKDLHELNQPKPMYVFDLLVLIPK